MEKSEFKYTSKEKDEHFSSKKKNHPPYNIVLGILSQFKICINGMFEENDELSFLNIG